MGLRGLPETESLLEDLALPAERLLLPWYHEARREQAEDDRHQIEVFQANVGTANDRIRRLQEQLLNRPGINKERIAKAAKDAVLGAKK